jgi:hypothetical protein
VSKFVELCLLQFFAKAFIFLFFGFSYILLFRSLGLPFVWDVFTFYLTEKGRLDLRENPREI